jgi:hypothetical protein
VPLASARAATGGTTDIIIFYINHMWIYIINLATKNRFLDELDRWLIVYWLIVG